MMISWLKIKIHDKLNSFNTFMKKSKKKAIRRPLGKLGMQ